MPPAPSWRLTRPRAEGYLTGSTMTFVVRLSNPLGAAASVDYGTVDGTPTARSDYTTTTGTLTFAAGETVKVVSVPVLGDAIVEANEAFTLVLSGASGATIADATAIGTILNDDGATISVTDFKIAEGTGAGTTNLAFTVINSQTAGALLIAFLLIFPFEHWRMGEDFLQPAADGAGPAGRRLPVLLVHGYGCSRAAWWWLRRRLVAGGWSVATINLEPI